jgi:hypothetical protein
MADRILAVWLTVILVGCDSGPRSVSGPAPWSGPGEGPTRLETERGPWAARYMVTFWDEGDGPVEATERIAGLRQAIPDELMERLRQKRRVPTAYDENVLIDQHVYKALATVVSLSPDVMIVTVRENSESFEDPFEPWIVSPQGSQLAEQTDLIAADVTWLSFHASTRLRFSDEMYVVSTDPDVEGGRLEFDGDRSVIPLPEGRLELTHDLLLDDEIVDVVRH